MGLQHLAYRLDEHWLSYRKLCKHNFLHDGLLRKNSPTSELARESRRIPLLTTAAATAAIVISAAEEENQDDPDTVIIATATVSAAESSAATATAQ